MFLSRRKRQRDNPLARATSEGHWKRQVQLRSGERRWSRHCSVPRTMESVLETLSKAGAVPESARATFDGSIERVSHACAKQVAVAVESLSTYTDFASKHIDDATAAVRKLENDFFKTPVRTVSKALHEYPYQVGAGALATSLIILPGPRRLLFRQVLGARNSEQAVFNSCNRSASSAKESVAAFEQELKLLRDKATAGEVEMLRGRYALKSAASELKRLQKKTLQNQIVVEDVLRDLRNLPSKESLALRTEVATTQSNILKVKVGVDTALANVWRAGVQI